MLFVWSFDFEYCYRLLCHQLEWQQVEWLRADKANLYISWVCVCRCVWAEFFFRQCGHVPLLLHTQSKRGPYSSCFGLGYCLWARKLERDNSIVIWTLKVESRYLCNKWNRNFSSLIHSLCLSLSRSFYFASDISSFYFCKPFRSTWTRHKRTNEICVKVWIFLLFLLLTFTINPLDFAYAVVSFSTLKSHAHSFI